MVQAENSSSVFPLWMASVSFVLFQFFMQLSSGVIIGAMMKEMQLTALTAGLLGSSLYFAYTTLQIPVGILFDRKETRTLMAVNASICSIGCFLFAFSHSLTGLFLGRFLIGAGSAFAFVGYSHILRQHFSLRRFAFLMGLSETLSFIVTVIGMISMGELLAAWGWRSFIHACGAAGFIIAFFCWRTIPATPQPIEPSSLPNYTKQLMSILKNGTAWINGLFVGLSFTVVTVFGALWAIPFIQVKLSSTLAEASIIGSMFFLGAGVSCPLFGFLVQCFSKRKPLIFTSCLATAVLLTTLLYLPFDDPVLCAALMFSIGCSCGAYMLAFSIANELAPIHSLSTCTGFTNTLAMLTAPLLQTFIGYLLDAVNLSGNYRLQDYQLALSVIPFSLLTACVLVFFLPEKKP